MKSKRNPTKSKAVLRKPAGAPVWFKSFESNLNQRLNKIDQRLERVEKDINHIFKVNKLVR